jgi:hypothetical protein
MQIAMRITDVGVTRHSSPQQVRQAPFRDKHPEVVVDDGNFIGEVTAVGTFESLADLVQSLEDEPLPPDWKRERFQRFDRLGFPLGIDPPQALDK